MIAGDRLSCEECRKQFEITDLDTPEEREFKADGPDCWECRPDLLPENEQAVEMYQHCSGQWICGAGGAVDLNLGTVMQAMDLFGIEDKKGCLLKVKTIAGVQLKKWRDEDQERQEERDNACAGDLR